MEKYNYREAMYNNICEYINSDFEKGEYADESGKWLREDNREEVQEALYDALWTCDAVTGNGSGSYTFNTWQTEENLCHNLDLLREACDEFGCKMAHVARSIAMLPYVATFLAKFSVRYWTTCRRIYNIKNR